MEGGGDRDQAMVRVEEAQRRVRSARERARRLMAIPQIGV
jgi:hypothetical protein